MEHLKFSELSLSDQVQKAIEKMGFEEATPIQSQAIPPILAGKDVVAQAPTGTGKTCAFGIPLIEKINNREDSIQALILCPTRELVLQTTEELSNLAFFKEGIRMCPIYGGQNIERQMMALRKRPQIIIATPGRMMDHLRRKSVRIDNLRMLVLDEADEMLNMGFREDLDIILETVPTTRQTILFSATMSKDILAIANTYQKGAEFVKVAHQQLTVPSIEQFYLEVKGKNKVEYLTRIIEHNQYKLSIIFCNTKRMVDELTDTLISRGYSAEALHGDMKQMQRDKVMARFRRGDVDMLIATDVAARGIDVDDIEAVFNFDVPADEEYYVHRIGRTGRINKKGASYTFVAGREMFKLRDIMRYTKATILPMKLPSITDVEEMKAKKFLEQIREKVTNENLQKQMEYIEKLIEDDDTDTLTTLDIAAALLKMVQGEPVKVEEIVEEAPESFERQGQATYRNDRGNDRGGDRAPRGQARDNRDADGNEIPMERLFMNIGRIDKVDPRSIVELIASAQGMRGKQIGVIDIYDKFSFVEVPIEMAEKVIESLAGQSYKGRTLGVEITTKKASAKGRKGYTPKPHSGTHSAKPEYKKRTAPKSE